MSKNFDDVFDYFKEEEVNRKERNKYILYAGIFAGGVLLGASFMFGFNHYLHKTKIIPLAQLPVIYPEPTPLKEEPQDEGGLEVLNRDKTVYNVIKNKEAIELSNNENVLPPPEEPINLAPKNPPVASQEAKPEHTAPAAAEETQSDESKVVHDIANMNESGSADEKEQAAQVSNEAKEIKEAKEAKELKEAKKEAKAQESKTVKKEAVVPPKDKPGDAVKSSRIQLGAFKSEVEARKAWEKIKKDDSSLYGLSPQISSITTANGALLYRLQVGPVNRDEAKSICQLLNVKHQECFFVK